MQSPTSSWVTIQLNIPVTGGIFSGSFTTPSEAGTYDIYVVFHGDNLQSGEIYHYKNSQATIVNATVVPEYLFAGLASLGTCFAAFLVFKKRQSIL